MFTIDPPTHFVIPTLPKRWYGLLKQVRKKYELSPWQCVILALQCLHRLGTTDEPRVLKLIEKLKAEFPAKYR